MHKYVWASFILSIVGAVLLFWTLKATVQYKPVMPRNVPRDTTTAELNEIKQRAREERTPPARAASRAVTAETEYDFGTLDPGAVSNHVFVIRNEGAEPLLLGDPQPTCDCAGAEFTRREIPPGESAELNIAWTVGDKKGAFSVGLSLPTSDPEHNPLYFRIQGRIRQQLGAAPNYFALGDLSPEKSPTTYHAVIFSEVWDNFQIENLQCTLAGATPSVTPATADELQAHRAKSGYRISLALPSDLPTGPLNGKIEFSARPTDSDKLHPFTMGVAGTVRGRYSIHGSAINQQGVVDLGTFARGEGKQTRLLIKLRDAEKVLLNPRIETEPACVTARLVEQGVANGLYTLEIEVPRDAPAEVHLRPDQWGTLTLLTDHPRIKSMKLRLCYAVTAREAANLP